MREGVAGRGECSRQWERCTGPEWGLWLLCLGCSEEASVWSRKSEGERLGGREGQEAAGGQILQDHVGRLRTLAFSLQEMGVMECSEHRRDVV